MGDRVDPGRQGIGHLGPVELLVEVTEGADQLDLAGQLRIRQFRGCQEAGSGVIGGEVGGGVLELGDERVRGEAAGR